MAGYHVIHRATNADNYVAVAGVLKLPSQCDCRSDNPIGTHNGVFPEFFFGFYKGGYGLDVGVLYFGEGTNAKGFRMFCNGLANTVNNANHYVDATVTLSKGSTYTLRVTRSGSNLIMTIDGIATQLSAPLTSGAVTAFSGGARINRELTCASNVSNYITSSAFFSDTTWSDTTMTTTSGSYVKMSITNSAVTHFADNNVTMNGNRWGYVDLGDANGFSKEYGSCDFR